MQKMEEIKEIWLPLFPDLYGERYEISNYSNVKNKSTGRLLAKMPHLGYLRVGLCINKKVTLYLLHRLVAAVFIDNDDPEKKTLVNHKDGNKLNNISTNLEWCDAKYNTRHAVDLGLIKKKIFKGKPITIIDNVGEEFKYPDVVTASKEAKIHIMTIRKALRDGSKPYGWIIKYTDEEDIPIIITDRSEFVLVKNHPEYSINKQGVILQTKSGKIIKPVIENNSYPRIGLITGRGKNKKNKRVYVHKLVAETFIPNPNSLPVVNHKDHNKLNYSIENLEWVTFKENTQKYLERKQNNSVLSQTEQSDDGSGENSEVEEKSEL